MIRNYEAGEFNQYISFCEIKNTQGEYGEQKRQFNVLFNAYARVIEQSGSQEDVAGKQDTSSKIKVICYFNRAVSSKLFVFFNSNYYEIEHIQPDSANHTMVITAEYTGEQKWQ